ncbi:hypothetical protein R1flu_006529 [Riccia fluitans]|uniref:2,4-dienoyl-CoA reductase [(3E)-enoyl-CoA-producing] n=1 Tax=Riccia fluitans TaxID=41844 RepID=A0ABD1YX37_9MARC
MKSKIGSQHWRSGLRGSGLEIATYFGKHGAKVSLMGRRKEVLDEAVKKLGAQGIKAIGVQGDVRNKDDCTRAVGTTVDELGRLDILINGAAGNFLCAAEDLSPNAFKTDCRLVTRSIYHLLNFYEDIFEELGKYGELESLNVCDNLADHMVGNVYVQFREEEQAAAALQADISTNGR